MIWSILIHDKMIKGIGGLAVLWAWCMQENYNQILMGTRKIMKMGRFHGQVECLHVKCLLFLFVWCFSEEAKARPDSDELEQTKSRLAKFEALNKTYEKNLKENAGQMLGVIEKMQQMVDRVMTSKFIFLLYIKILFFLLTYCISFYRQQPLQKKRNRRTHNLLIWLSEQDFFMLRHF